MASLKALREVRYGGATYLPGASFEASDKDAKLLVAIKKAEYGGVAKNKTDLPAPKTEEAPVEPEAPLQPAYHRRDMQAAGLTGEEKPSQSSRRGRPRKERTSRSFEDDAV